MAQTAAAVRTLEEIEQSQLNSLLEQLPAITLAPLAGVFFTAWVLWDKSNNTVLVFLGLCVLAVSLVRLLAYIRFLNLRRQNIPLDQSWQWFTIGTALVSGLTWGAFAIFLYPVVDPAFERFLIILLALVPIAPVAALATYIPSFYAYYVPASAPFVIVLLLEQTFAGWTSAVLLVILMFATLQFARNFHKNLTETLRLQIRERETAEKLRESLMAKSQFMSDANHDLRQPLQSLELALLAEARDKKATEPSQNLSSARLAVASMKDYLDRLYQYSELDQAIALETTSFPISRILDRLEVLFSPVAKAKNTELICVPSSLWVASDENSIDTITRNQVENAIRYAGPSRKVLIGCRRTKDQVMIHVLDNGPGIAPNDQARVFEEFVQLNNPTRERTKGIGLGLSIAQRAAKRINSELTLRSVLGKGSNFSLALTRAATAVENHQGERKGVEGRKNRSLHVMIIDGEEPIRSGLVDLFASWGHSAQAAPDIETALHLVARHGPPEILITDYRLEPSHDGFDAIAAVKGAIGHDIPSIIITGDTSPAVETRAERENCYFFRKPVEIGSMRKLISRLSRRPAEL